MDQIRQVQVNRDEATRELEATEISTRQARGDIRSLDEWELLLVGGGDDTPWWP